MRPLEVLLIVADLVAFLALVIPLWGSAHWLRFLALVPLPAMAAQLFIEGARWQMIPAYVLAGLFATVRLLKNVKPAGLGSGRRSRAHAVTIGLGTGLGVLALAISVALPIILPVFHFPPPTGPYAIGTLTYHWVDTDRPERFTADPDDRRELMVQIWYPAEAEPSSPRAPYMPDADVVAPALARFLNLPAFALEHLKYITTHAVTSAPVADAEPSYPVLILLVGAKGSYRQVQTFQVEELVSHGYIVAAIDQPYTAAMVVFPDGRQLAYDPRWNPPHSALMDRLMPYIARDVSFTLDQLAALNQADPNGILTGRLDLQRVGLVGHSLGAIDGGQACLMDPHLRACLLEDGFMPDDVVRAGLQQPTMFITRDAATMRLERQEAGGWAEKDIHETLSTMRTVYESLPGDGYYVQVPGMFHLDMTDAPSMTPLASRLRLSGPIGGQRAHLIINAYSVAFFDRELRGLPAPLLDGPTERYPEVLFESRRP
jgi:predicted dienelactone hydrolase